MYETKAEIVYNTMKLKQDDRSILNQLNRAVGRRRDRRGGSGLPNDDDDDDDDDTYDRGDAIIALFGA